MSKVLVEQYGSQEIQPMHKSYDEFQGTANEAERAYFTFTSIRNPLDSIVSSYFKMKSDHNGRFSRGSFKDGRPLARSALEAYRFIKQNNASFAQYFRQFHQESYHLPRHEATVEQVDDVLRFESLERDFARLMQQLRLPVYPIPHFNQTAGRSKDFLSYYSADIIPQAIRVMGPLMHKWNYSFPAAWKGYY